MGTDSSDILGRVSSLENGDSSREIYDDWSDDYDAHLLREFGYISPAVAARELAAGGAGRDIEIVDYGCGTGLVGEALAAEGFVTVDGLDISAGMLEQARAKRIYRNLIRADLTAGLALEDASYDAACCIGSMGAGHVGAEQVPELLRPLRGGALFVVILNGAYYRAGGFEEAFRQYEIEGLWRIVKLDEFNYMTELIRPGWLLVAEKT